MKKGFTLVEMLIVVVVLVTLMSITFRLTSLGDDQTRRNRTISRLQRVENCLSGYYAAFGTYPPVALHGSRDYNLEVDDNTGIQKRDSESSEQQVNLSWYQASGSHGIGSETEKREWRQVRAACYSQPIAVRAPVPDGFDSYIAAKVRIAQSLNANAPVFTSGYSSGASASFTRDVTDWREMQLFQYGLMSYLLPRYFIMMNAGSGADQFYLNYDQWTAFNKMPSNQIETGSSFGSWDTFRKQWVKTARSNRKSRQYAAIASIPSQAVCARWLPNLEDTCLCSMGAPTSYYGIDIDNDEPSYSSFNYEYAVDIFGTSGAYHTLSSVTVLDGWGNELYYYSPKPYQGYVLWSSGQNERTFPPWVSRDTLTPMQNKCVGVWTEDDIVHMSN